MKRLAKAFVAVIFSISMLGFVPAGAAWATNAAVNAGTVPSGAMGLTLNAIAYGNGHWVALGPSGAGYASTDGRTWVEQGDITFEAHDVTYGNGKFVAVGEGSYGVSTDNGQTWTVGNFPSGWYSDVIYAAGQFMATEDDDCNGQFAYSTTGSNWTIVDTDNSACWADLAYGNGTVVIVGDNKLDYSNDLGHTWHTAGQNIIQDDFTTVAFGDGKFIALGWNSSGNSTEIATSTNGNTWNLPATNAVLNISVFRSLEYANGEWLATSWQATKNIEVAKSADGVTWVGFGGAGYDYNQECLRKWCLGDGW